MSIFLLLSLMTVLEAPPAAQPLNSVERFAELALACVHREYPNKISHVLNGNEDAQAPRQLTPVFYGCYDWHSSVHGHWLLVRLMRLFPDAPFATRSRAALAASFVPARIAGEVNYLRGKGRTSFERPYGLAWLLQLTGELREWKDPQSQEWAAALAPLESEAIARIAEWVPKLTAPIRVGEHSQTAFSFGLILDWASSAGRADIAALLTARSRQFYGTDRNCPIEYEPSGEDFLSPCIAEADLMRRVFGGGEFSNWLRRFLPGIPVRQSTAWLRPGVVTDPTDPKLSHLDGLNLSRAWMLEGIISGIPASDPRRHALEAAAREHRDAGLRAVTGVHYEGGHWLATFATYLVTRRGIR